MCWWRRGGRCYSRHQRFRVFPFPLSHLVVQSDKMAVPPQHAAHAGRCIGRHDAHFDAVKLREGRGGRKTSTARHRFCLSLCGTHAHPPSCPPLSSLLTTTGASPSWVDVHVGTVTENFQPLIALSECVLCCLVVRAPRTLLNVRASVAQVRVCRACACGRSRGPPTPTQRNDLFFSLLKRSFFLHPTPPHAQPKAVATRTPKAHT